MSSKYKKKIENLKRVQHHTFIHKKNLGHFNDAPLLRTLN